MFYLTTYIMFINSKSNVQKQLCLYSFLKVGKIRILLTVGRQNWSDQQWVTDGHLTYV